MWLTIRIRKENDFTPLKEFTKWKTHIEKYFSDIKISDITYDKKLNFSVGENLKVDVLTDLGAISPEDVKVEVYFGRMERDDRLMSSELVSLNHNVEHSGEGTLFSGSISCRTTGNLGFKIRITPRHDFLVNSMEMNLVKWG